MTIPDSVTSIGGRVFEDCCRPDQRDHRQRCDQHWVGCILRLQGPKEVIYNAKAITDGSYAFKEAGTAAVGMKVVFGESVRRSPATFSTTAKA